MSGIKFPPALNSRLTHTTVGTEDGSPTQHFIPKGVVFKPFLRHPWLPRQDENARHPCRRCNVKCRRKTEQDTFVKRHTGHNDNKDADNDICMTTARLTASAWKSCISVSTTAFFFFAMLLPCDTTTRIRHQRSICQSSKEQFPPKAGAIQGGTIKESRQQSLHALCRTEAN